MSLNQRYHTHGTQKKEKFILHVDSRDRDVTMYPDQNEYRIPLPTEYRNIYRVSMLTAEFDHATYAIDSTNNVFVMQNEGAGNPVIMTLAEGTYTGQEFADEIANTVDANFTNSMSVEFRPPQRKLYFSHPTIQASANPILRFMIQDSKDSTTLSFSENLMWEAMGLDGVDANPDVNETWVVGSRVPYAAPETVKIAPDRYVIMNVAFPRIFQGRMSSTGPHPKVFAKIIFDEHSNEPIGNVYDFVSSPVCFVSVMRVKFISFQFVRPNGALHDFHNQEHSFTLEFLTQA